MTYKLPDNLEELIDDPELMKAHVINELRKIVEVKLRADDLKYFRLVYYGTEGSGDKIIPYAI